MTKKRLRELSNEFQQMFVDLGFEKYSSHQEGLFVTYRKQMKSGGFLNVIFHDSALGYDRVEGDLITVFCNVSDVSNLKFLEDEGFGMSGKNNFHFPENQSSDYKQLISNTLQRWIAL